MLKIIIEKSEQIEGEKYPSSTNIYEQQINTVDKTEEERIVKNVIMAVNRLEEQAAG